MPEAHFVSGKTVLIFDEIQECSNARASIKAFMIDSRYDIVCTGSLRLMVVHYLKDTYKRY